MVLNECTEDCVDQYFAIYNIYSNLTLHINPPPVRPSKAIVLHRLIHKECEKLSLKQIQGILGHSHVVRRAQ